MSIKSTIEKCGKKILSAALALTLATGVGAVASTTGYVQDFGSITASAATKFTDNGSSISASSIWVGSSLTAYARFKGGSGTYKYKYSYRLNNGSWRDVTGYTTKNSQKITLPSVAGHYTVRVASLDSKNNYASKYLYVTVKRNTNSAFKVGVTYLQQNTTWVNWTVEAHAGFSGGVEPYTYKYSYHNGNGKWVDATGYVNNNVQKIKMPGTPGYYTVRIAAKDATGKYLSKYCYIPIKKDTKQKFAENGSKISTNSTWANWTITASAKFKGGVAPYRYKFSYQKEGQNNWVDVTDYVYTDTKKITMPNDGGYYTVRIASRDSKGQYASKYMKITVKKDTKSTFRDAGSEISSDFVFNNSTVAAYADFTGGVKPYKYKFDYRIGNGSWKTIQNYSTNDMAIFKTENKTGSYTVRICAKDVTGRYTSKYVYLTAISSSPTITSDMNHELSLINNYRQQAGLKPLTLDKKLTAAAQVRAQEIEKKQSHTRPDGRECFSILEDLNIGYGLVGENIAWGYQNVDSVMSAWMSSAGHRENILHNQFSKVGIGIYKNYYVQLFD